MITPLSSFSQTIFERTYQFNDNEDWSGCAKRVSEFVADGDQDLADKFYHVINERKFMPGGRYLYSSGREIPQVTNCFLMKAEDSREGWGELVNVAIQALTTGGGVGTEYSEIRGAGTPIKRYGGVASGPISLMAMVNEVARHVMAGGKRRSALWAGLVWNHPDIEEFLKVKNWSTAIKAMKEQDYNFPAMLDMTNISMRLDADFFKAMKAGDPKVQELYYNTCRSMCKTGEPGFSVDLNGAENDILRNPCTEVVSSENGDCCNLGSVNLARIRDLNELEYVTRLATRFLYMGTYRGWLPHSLFVGVREGNRRIGLGILGLHEWCLINDQRYEPSGNLGRWLSTWEAVSNEEAGKISTELGGPFPAGVRAVAPTGTIGILAGTSTGIEPIYCTAYKRRYLNENQRWSMQYIVDPTVKRLVDEHGFDPNEIEDAMTLAEDVERRMSMQAFVQDFVDQAISSTINLPEWGEPGNNNAKEFGRTLLRYLPRLRGVTAYPDKSRPGQPLEKVDYEEALKRQPKVEETEEQCAQGACGI